jgi:hypothetical protein
VCYICARGNEDCEKKNYQGNLIIIYWPIPKESIDFGDPRAKDTLGPLFIVAKFPRAWAGGDGPPTLENYLKIFIYAKFIYFT